MPNPADGPNPLPFDPAAGAGWLADDMPPDGAAVLSQVGTRGAWDAAAALPTLADFLPALEHERAPGEAGGVPLPETWTCVRAALEGASRRDLEHAHALPAGSIGAEEADERVRNRAAAGSHLPAGLHVVTGQTGGGKSALVMNLAHAALAAGHPVVYVTLELDGVELAARLLALDTGLPWWKLAQRRTLPDAERARRAAGVAALRGRAALVTVLAPDTAGAVRAIRPAVLAAWRAHGRTPLVVVDYLQAVADLPAAGDYRPQLREYVGAVARELRDLSRVAEGEHATEDDNADTWQGCPVVALSITARNNVRGEGAVRGLDGANPDELRREDLETLKALPKEAGAVEAYAVTSWVLALGEAKDAGPRPMALRLAKYRGGLAGQWVPFTFDGQTGRLEEEPARYAAARADDVEAARAAEERQRKRSAANGDGAPDALTPAALLSKAGNGRGR